MNISFAQETTPPTTGQESCTDGQRWDAPTAKCVLTDETVESRNSARACEEFKDNPVAYRNCFKRNAEERGQEIIDQESDGMQKQLGRVGKGGKALGNSIMPLAMTILSGYFLLNNKTKFTCPATSMWLIAGAGVAGITGEALAYFGHKRRMSVLAKEYEESTMVYAQADDEDKYAAASENQMKAFEYLLQVEKSALKGEKARHTAHKIATGLYGAALIAAVVEGIQQGFTGGNGETCGRKGKSSSYSPINKQSPATERSFQYLALVDQDFAELHYIKNITQEEIKESIFRKVYRNVFPTLRAEESSGGNGMLLTVAFAALPLATSLLGKGGGTGNKAPKGAKNNTPQKKQDNKFDQYLSYPVTRAAMAGVFGTFSNIVAVQAKHNAEDLEKRIAAIEELKADFESSGAAGGFEMCEGKKCFKKAVKEDGTNWNETERLLAEANSGCVNKQGKIDTQCKCKRQKQKSGKNNCASFKSSFNFAGAGAASFASPFTAGYTDLNNGNLEGAQYTGDGFDNKLFALRKKIDKIKKNKKYKKFTDKADKIGLKIRKHSENLIKKRLPSGYQHQGLAGLPSGLKGNSSLSKVLKKAKDQISKKSKAKFVSGKSMKKSKSKPDFNLDFDDEVSPGIKVEEIASVMNKEFDIKGDINNNPTQNIFKILSNRYQRSALRRLFDEDGKSSSDSASETDINGI
jgi:hypothetical protein